MYSRCKFFVKYALCQCNLQRCGLSSHSAYCVLQAGKAFNFDEGHLVNVSFKDGDLVSYLRLNLPKPRSQILSPMTFFLDFPSFT